MSILSVCGDEDLPYHGRDGSNMWDKLNNKRICGLQIPVPLIDIRSSTWVMYTCMYHTNLHFIVFVEKIIRYLTYFSAPYVVYC